MNRRKLLIVAIITGLAFLALCVLVLNPGPYGVAGG